VNNPTNHIDPTGHQFEVVIAVTFTVVAVLYIGAVVYSTPQMQRAGQEAHRSITNAIDNLISRILPNSGKTADSPDWLPKPLRDACFSSVGAFVKCGVLVFVQK